MSVCVCKLECETSHSHMSVCVTSHNVCMCLYVSVIVSDYVCVHAFRILDVNVHVVGSSLYFSVTTLNVFSFFFLTFI
jgi:hypothetical protein